jgi:hypothetical protein
MKPARAMGLVCAILLVATGHAWAELDPSAPFLCASAHTVECDDDRDCHHGRAESINFPDFMWFDLQQKEVGAGAS